MFRTLGNLKSSPFQGALLQWVSSKLITFINKKRKLTTYFSSLPEFNHLFQIRPCFSQTRPQQATHKERVISRKWSSVNMNRTWLMMPTGSGKTGPVLIQMPALSTTTPAMMSSVGERLNKRDDNSIGNMNHIHHKQMMIHLHDWILSGCCLSSSLSGNSYRKSVVDHIPGWMLGPLNTKRHSTDVSLRHSTDVTLRQW